MNGVRERFRPSASMVVAFLALFVALGGAGYAAVAINGKNIKNRTVGAKKIKRNALTGAEIKESKLGQVKRAARARSATRAATATDADRLDGVNAADLMRKKTRLFESSTTTEVANFATDATIGTLANIPPGIYMVSAKLSYDNDDAAGGDERCRLQVPGLDDVGQFSTVANGAGDQQVIKLQEVVSSAAAFNATVTCTSDGDDDVDEISVIAIAVD